MLITGNESFLHKESKCAGERCIFHNPTEHKMRDWPMNLRVDDFASPLIERICPHGIGHPDPDSVAYMAKIFGNDWGTHGCDGCCFG